MNDDKMNITFQQLLDKPFETKEERMEIYPLILASAIIDVGGKMEISERALREAYKIVSESRKRKTGDNIMELRIVEDNLILNIL